MHFVCQDSNMYFMIGKHFKHCNLQNLKFFTFPLQQYSKTYKKHGDPLELQIPKLMCCLKNLCSVHFNIHAY